MKTRTKIILVVIAAFLVWGGYELWFVPKASTYDLATAKRGTLVQIVSITGNTAPVHSVTLAFQTTGVVAAVNADVGSHVNAGDVIARLDTRDLEAQLAQAKANVDTQTADLQSLQAGSRPEDIAAAQATLGKAQQDLANMYANVPSTLLSGYAEANDAVRNQISPFFTGAETTNPQLTFSVNDSQTLNDIQFERVEASTELNAWQAEIAAINTTSPSSTLEATLQKAAAHLSIVGDLLTTAAQALVEQTSLTASTLATYKTDVTNALSEVNTATTAVNSLGQNIASQKLTVAGLQADLNKEIAGPTSQDIAAQQAQVEQAQAAVQKIQVEISQAALISPVSGTVTQEDAKVGQTATAGTVLVSVLSDQGLEVDAYIAETDIGKVAVGDEATMTLDAFQGQSFSGKVTYIDPGETVTQGVPTYKTTFQFNLPSGAKPGMTANIDITTATHENVVYVPQRMVTTDAQGNRTVQRYHGAGQPLTTSTVTVGIRDQNGNIEIISGLNEGDVVARPSG
jgi:HlyD family secretion protein